MHEVKFDDIAGINALASEEFGDWGAEVEVTQDKIDAFAELTGDRQWIHVDVERAKKESPFGGPIAHGFLTLSLLPAMASFPLKVTGQGSAVNYGASGLRFLAPAGQRYTRVPDGSEPTESGFEVTTHGGRRGAGLDAVAWAREAARLGAGEILLNAMDADGTQDGFDLDLIRAVRREVTIPVIASGGAGTVEHFPPAVDAGADAVLAATVFHFGTLRIGEVKAALAGAGHPVR